MTSAPLARERSGRHGWTQLTYVDVTGAILLIASISWVSVGITEYAQQGVGTLQIATRIVPLLGVTGYLFLRDSQHGLATVRRLFRWPCSAFVWYAVVAALAGLINSELPLLAAWKSCEVLAVAYWSCHAARVSERRGDTAVLSRMVKLVIAVMILILVLAVVNPSEGFRSAAGVGLWLQGYFPPMNPNAIGVLSVLGLYSILRGAVRFNSRTVTRLAALAVFTCTVLARSRTAYVTMGVLLVLTFVEQFFHKADRRRLGRVALIVGLAGIGLLSMEMLLDYLARDQRAEEIMSLSGRLDFWRVAMRSIKEHPIIGSGMATGSRYLYLLEPKLFRDGLVNLHSAFFEAVAAAGLLGGLPLLIAYVGGAFRGLFRLFVDASHRLPFEGAVALILVIRGLTSIAPALFSIEMLMFAVTLQLFPRLRRRRAVRAAPASLARAGSPLSARQSTE